MVPDKNLISLFMVIHFIIHSCSISMFSCLIIYGTPYTNNKYENTTEIRFLSGTIWVIFWGVVKTGFSLVFYLQFLDFTYLQTWDAPARRVREYPIKLFKVESLGLGLRFWGLNSHRPSRNPIFGGVPEKPPFGTRLKPSSQNNNIAEAITHK